MGREREKAAPCPPAPAQPAPTFRRMVRDMEALAWMMMVAVLSSRISLRSGVGSLVSSSMRTESVSLEMRNCRSSFSRFRRPGGEEDGALRYALPPGTR